MHLRVIEGGRNQEARRRGPVRADVEAEAARRGKTAGYERMRARHLTTGEPIPKPLQHLKIQMDWVVEALSGIDPIPADYADDKYWPDQSS
jgi:hypothetical protein